MSLTEERSTGALDVARIRADFPVLQRTVGDKQEYTVWDCKVAWRDKPPAKRASGGKSRRSDAAGC